MASSDIGVSLRPDLSPSLRKFLTGTSIGYISILIGTAIGVTLTFLIDGYFSFILALVAMNVMVGVGLNVLLGLSGQVSFGHVGFFAIGAYAVGILTLNGVDFWLAFPAAGLFAGLIGLLLAVPVLRVTGPYLAMMTIAFAFIVEHGAIEWRGLTGGANGLFGFPQPVFFGHAMNEADIALLSMICAGLCLLFYHRLSYSLWGQAMTAVRDSEVAAQSVGLNLTLIKTVSFVLSALLTGLAGALFAPLNGFISPSSFPFFQSILFILAVVVGGAGTLWGPVVGAIVIVLLPEFLSDFAEYRPLMFGILLLAVLWAAPRGIVGTLAKWLMPEREGERPDSAAAGSALSGANGGMTLKLDGLGISFGGVRAAHDVSLVAEPSRVTSIIGPNGAGKTTVLNMVSGFYKPQAGSIALESDLTGLSAHKIARSGIARTYQTTQLFADMSVIGNVMIALRRGHLGMLLASGDTKSDREAALALLAFVGYRGDVEKRAGDLPHVDKRLVEVARALATRPKALLLDEPAAGLMSDDKKAIAKLLKTIAESGIAVILVEHDMSLVMGISDHILVLDAGEPLREGKPEAIREDPAVLQAYLGESTFEGRPRAEAWKGEKVAILATRDLEAGYGAAPVLKKLNVIVNPGEMVTMLGANGAGKSTMMRALSGLHRPVEGTILLDDKKTEGDAAHEIAAAGLALVPEGRQVFPELTLRENIELGGWCRNDPVTDEEIAALMERFPRLKDRIDSKAGVLSGGEQQMLAIARGLIAKPKILLLDEPSLGLAPSMIAELFDVLADLRDEGVTILLVDQMANLALTIADRAYLLESGEIVKEGEAHALKDDPSIEKAYLGGS
ncbi:MAG: branched-chain amino acid ABC transporter ATP-binding protein/permease [Pseudomonadota bacterium]